MKTKFQIEKTWQFFKQVREIFGINYATELYSRKQTTIYTWGADPAYCAENTRNPLDRIKDNFCDLHEAGKTEIAVAAANLLLAPIDYEAVPIEKTEPGSNNIKDECLNNIQALAKLQAAILNNRSLKYVRRLRRQLKEQVDGTMYLYEMKKNTKR